MGLLASLFELAADVVDVVRQRQAARKTEEGAIRAAWLKGYRSGAGLDDEGGGSRIGHDARAEWDRLQVEAKKRDDELRAKMRGE